MQKLGEEPAARRKPQKRFNKARLIALLAVAFQIFPSFSSQTGEITAPGGGVVKYTNADEVKTLSNGEIVLIYTNAAAEEASFELPGTTSARILAVGGGGGGGSAYYKSTRYGFTSPYGGAGGGGAGAMLETNDLFSVGVYSVSVGKGGAGADYVTDTDLRGINTIGESGGVTTVKMNDAVELLKAPGGGGGAGESDGRPGASGGGGSQYNDTDAKKGVPKNGGAGVDGQGYKGGAGDLALFGGGGGGAGGEGAAASTLDPKGGIGRPSDITGESVYYAGGGGGGCTDKSKTDVRPGFGLGYEYGGGGLGGYGKNVAPTPGLDGFGGGGGGASANTAGSTGGARGGCGAVIVRIEASLAGGLKKPVDPAPIYFDGEGHEVYSPAPAFYTIDGENNVTNVGFHTVTVTPNVAKGITWDDGSEDSVAVTLLIAAADSKSGSIEVTGAPVEFFGAATNFWVYNEETKTNDLVLGFTGAGTYKLLGTTSARILAVGGGGGGGSAYYKSTRYGFTSPYGGAGGGGAGGFVETNDLMLGEAVYSVSVGAGGAGADYVTDTDLRGINTIGEDGGATTVKMNGVEMVKALGGGGGAGESDGRPGASGGGGSQYNDTDAKKGVPKNGGAGVAGQGCKGGAGDLALFGGGGGGAGGEGAAASTEDPKGGIGRQSDITGESVYYAGGGGGGCTDKSKTDIRPGFGLGYEYGGGGLGGYGKNVAPTPGLDGFGGGGGGASANTAGSTGGAKGGSGVFYIRISSTMRGEFKKPTDVTVAYDAKEHVSIEDNIFYTVTGENVGTTVGVYRATAHLRGGTWPDKTTDDVTVALTITNCVVTLSDLHLELDGVRTNQWMFGDKETPKPVVTADPNWARREVGIEYLSAPRSEDAAGTVGAGGTVDEWSLVCPTNAGSYLVRARIADEWNFSCAAVTSAFEIVKCEVAFSDLYQRSWMAGTPEEDVPQPSCLVTPPWVTPVYQWKAAGGDGEWTDWSEAKPTELGSYEMRVGAPDADNYAFAYATAEFSIFGGRGDLYTDYVEIEIAPYTGSNPSVLTNFPYKLTLSETDPTGFLYSRAGPTGTKIAFTDSNTNSLPFEIAAWVTNGVSTVYVRIPEIGPKKQTIRLYWHLRDGQIAPFYTPEEVWTDWSREDRDKISQPAKSITQPVMSDGKFVNYWVQDVVLSSSLWDTNDPKEKWGKIDQDAKLAFGEVERTISNLVTGVTYEQMPTNAFGGSFRIVYVQKDTARWPTRDFYPLETHADFAITSHVPWDDLQGDAKTLTLSGRVMIANDDDIDEKHGIHDQSYWRTREVVTNATTGATLTNDVFWVHGGEEHGTYDSGTKNMLPGSSHWLKYVEKGIERTLWRLDNVIIGNMYPNTGRPYSSQSCLPWSPSQLGISSYANRNVKNEMNETGNLILRNKAGAVIYSPFYTNGIGTIYFDAVNGFNDEKGFAHYRIVVEIATLTKEGKIPTDENAAKENAQTIEEELDKIVDWKPVQMLPLFRNGEGQPLTPLPKTNELMLAQTVGRTTNHFYRICAKVDCRGPVRFRIRRPYANENVGFDADNGGQILIDNIIVSYPQMSADVEPYGKFERTRTYDQTLGWENAMMTPFPAVTDAELLGRGKVTPFVTEGVTSVVDPREFVVQTKMHYQWSYLNQASNEWDEVVLHPGDDFVSRTPLKFPKKEGDIDFWYESFLNVPYYDYFDYSGTGLKLGGLYVESDQVVTNRNASWFFRLRAGQSLTEDFKMIVKTAADAEPETFDMSLVSDGTWRGFFPTRDEIAGDDGKGIYVRFEAHNRQMAGRTSFATNVAYYVLGSDLTTLDKPTSIVRVEKNDLWSRVVCDGKTGQLLFQLVETTLAASVVHADFMNFNLWNDANKTNGVGRHLFVGTSAATSGVSAVARQIDENFAWWHPSVPTNDYWQEFFNVKPEEMARGQRWEVYQPFSEEESPNGFTVGPGQWVTGAYRDPQTGMALQLEGRGKGFFQFVNAVESPRGIEAISFRPRLAQFLEFGDFSYFDGDKMSLTNYTFYCRGAYDVNNRRDFKGNASLSVVAFYKAGAGCYEFRVEQESANIQHTATGDVINPGNTHLLSLYRWSYDDESGEITAELLGSSSFGDSNTLTTMGEKGNYGILFISVENDAKNNWTKVNAGLSKAVAGVSSTSAITHRWLSYIDDDAKRLKNGAYGFLSANCPGRFRNLRFNPKAQTSVATKVKTFTTKDQNFTPSGGTSCQDDIGNGGWVIQPRRAEYIDADSSTAFGFRAAPVTNQVLNVYTAPAGSTSFKTLLLSTNITSYGSIDAVKIPLWSLDECSVKIAAGGTAKSARNDIVLDDIVFTQWRGEHFDDTEGKKYFDETGYGSPSNFVFTQAWILTNEETQAVSVELNARRSKADVATSIRSPLFDGKGGRGLGLGMFSFAYTNAQPNARLKLQVCTNGVDETVLARVSKEADAAEKTWKTLATYDFSLMTEEERAGGSFTHYLGWHGVPGVFRLVVDPALAGEVVSISNATMFGSVEITAASCRDEPDLDKSSWWGWNIQTTDERSQMYLADVGRGGVSSATGLAFGLNNSVSADLYDDPELYLAHVPFLQTPTFSTETVGEVNFKARKYDLSDPDCRVTLYGARTGLVSADRDWTPLRYFTVTNDLFETFSYKTEPGEKYCAFRFAVTGVANVDEQMPPAPPQEDPPLADPVKRVLIDEVVVLEAIRARVGFRNVGAFRNDLQGTEMIQYLPRRDEQPLCRESWGVQAELFVPQLADEVDLSTAEVRLWWFDDLTPWGFDKWKDDPRAKCAQLAPCADSNLVFRSSYATAGDAIIPPKNSFAVVQYMLEVTYRLKNGSKAVSYLTDEDWKTPDWYSPVDYNAEYGGASKSFSAYTILDTVAPGWAWINELNIYGEYDEGFHNSDKPLQFVEIAAPNDADLTGWKIRFLDGQFWAKRVVTNTVAEFGVNSLPGIKAGLKGMDPESKCVFHVIGSPNTAGSLNPDDGRMDGYWSFDNYQMASDQLNASGEIAGYHPLSVQLVRPSGIIEHEITGIGTNYYYWTDETCVPEKHVDFLNEKEREIGGKGKFFSVGADEGGTAPGNVWSRSLGVFAGNGESFMQWGCTNTMTPGRINGGQVITGTYPQPLGTMVAIYSLIGSQHLRQTFGDLSKTNDVVKIFFQKGSEKGTNVTYHLDQWYELDAVTQTVDGVSRAMPSRQQDRYTWTVEVGKGVSNDVTVVAYADVDGRLKADYGLGPDNRYTDAVVRWLQEGRTLKGEPFHDPEAESLGLAAFAHPGTGILTNLDLTAMYWLDIDPTYRTNDIWLVGGFSKAPVPTPVRDETLTNVVSTVFMMITNTVNNKAWAPYVIRSVTPGVTSWDYAESAATWNWNSATFKMTGILSNDGTIPSPGRNRERWLPLRWFVFDDHSFENFQSEVELVDPYSKESPGYGVGWYDWVQKHGWCPVYWAWDLDDRMQPTEIEVLRPTNRYEY